MLIWPFSVQIFKILSKKTIAKVRGGGGDQQSMVKGHTLALFNFVMLGYVRLG